MDSDRQLIEALEIRALLSGDGSTALEPPASVLASDSPAVYTPGDPTFSRVSVTWTKVSGTVRYQVWRSRTNDAEDAKRIASIDVNKLPGGRTRYDDYSAVPGRTYFYFLRAKEGVGYTEFSAPDAGRRGQLAAPGNVQASDGDFLDRIRVRWNSVTGADEYSIFRGTTRKLADAELVDTVGPNRKRWFDEDVVLDQDYFYWVRATNEVTYSPKAGPNKGTAVIKEAIDGADLAVRSSGSASGDDWVLTENGFVGTYITVPYTGRVKFTVLATGTTSDGVDPRLRLVVGDKTKVFKVEDSGTFSRTLNLPEGTHFVRVDFKNDVPSANRTLRVQELRTRGVASVSNLHNDTNALNAANSYIDNYRKGTVTINLPGIDAGTEVDVELIRNAFNFGTAVEGVNMGGLLGDLTPTPGSNAAKYQQFILDHFNTIVPENAGKWAFNVDGGNNPSLAYLDNILTFAEQNDLRSRMHAGFWGANGSQPAYIHTLINQALGGDDDAKDELRAEITERIDYYVRDRADEYFELDVINESLHQSSYLTIFGIDGMADIHNEISEAIEEAGANTRLFVNEYNVLQWSSDPINGGPLDPFANWYRRHAEDIRHNGGDIDSIGVQYYLTNDSNARANNPHSPARIHGVFNNLAVSGMSLSLTEYGIQNTDVSATQAADFLEESIRMVFGNPAMNTFMMWGFWQNAIWDQATRGILVDSNFNLTPAGVRYEALMDQWSTDLTTDVDANGNIQFNGFWGDYEITVDGQTYALTIEKGTNEYTLTELDSASASVAMPFQSTSQIQMSEEDSDGDDDDDLLA